MKHGRRTNDDDDCNDDDGTDDGTNDGGGGDTDVNQTYSMSQSQRLKIAHNTVQQK